MKINKLITAFLKWIKNISDGHLFMSPPREWCLLGMTEAINSENITEHFNRTELNVEYIKRFNESDIRNKQSKAFIKCEINYIYGFHKGFANRHKSRLQAYRDDAECKSVRTWNAVAKSMAMFNSFKNIVESNPDATKAE